MADKDNSEQGSDFEDGPVKKREVIHDAVDSFLGHLLQGLKTRNIVELHKLYEDTLNKLTDKYYKNARWPSPETVEEDVSAEPLFMIVYKEIYYRHVYSRISVTFADRKGSWYNYCSLLDLILDDLEKGEDLSIALPPQWVWDTLDEFIYHYQTFCSSRNKAKKQMKDKEVQEFIDNPEVFATPKVLDYLHRIIRASRIEEYLTAPDNPKGITKSSWTDETTRLLGYFAMIQLLRMHSLLGDYYFAMQTIESIDFDSEVPLFYKIPACHLSLHYYMGFAYMMLRRYKDAIATFTSILVFLQKTSGVNTISYQYEIMAKARDQMYALLMICLSLCPQQIDESLDKDIRDKHGEKQGRLQRGEEACFKELFSYACPKFISAAVQEMRLDSAKDFDINEAHNRQLSLFIKEVKEQQMLPHQQKQNAGPIIQPTSCMKLYTAITTAKLAALCEMDEEGLRDTLLCVIHKTNQRVRTKGSPLAGDLQACSEVEFFLDGNMVHINAHKPERPHAEVFLEQILKFQDLLKKIDQGRKEKE